MSKKPKHDDADEAAETDELEKAEQTDLDISTAAPTGPVECLGMTFPSDAARREHFLKELAKKLKDPAFRKIEGFPIGEDEDILALSDPPYYTACPNPWLADFVKHYGRPYNPKEKYHREPFAADVSEGKNHPIYNAHSYHTKVPHRAIMRYILHYTQPGDLVFDGFAGTGMTGIAAQMCGAREEIQALGYRVQDDGTILDEQGRPFSRIGTRCAIMNDLSPVASFIAFNYNAPVNATTFQQHAKSILDAVEQEAGWMYVTIVGASEEETKSAAKAVSQCRTEADCRALLASEDTLRNNIGAAKSRLKLRRIDYTVWSAVFSCPECGHDIVFRQAATDDTGKVMDDFPCPHCSLRVTKRQLHSTKSTFFDSSLNKPVEQDKLLPDQVFYQTPQGRKFKKSDEFDLALVEKIANFQPTHWIPTNRMPEGDESQRNDPSGITHVHHFYVSRALRVLASLLKKSRAITDFRTMAICHFLFEQWAVGFSKLNRYSPHHYSQNNRNLSGTLYIGSQLAEVSPSYALEGKLRRLVNAFASFHARRTSLIATGSATADLGLTNALDYIFVDPPFGGNLPYSALNFLWEAWLRIVTNNNVEAITNGVLGRELPFYHNLMAICFREFYRALKPGRWLTIEFSNTQASVWNTIQSVLQEAGFVVANVSALDKKSGSFKAVTTPTAVKQDLVISAYKPNGGLEDRFAKNADTDAGVWDFLRTHLNNLPVVKPKGGQLEPIAERDARILYDRTVAFYVRHGIPVPISSPEFQAGLAEKFPERDGMFFLPDQAAEYDKVRMKMEGIGQLTIFVEDERSAVDWLRNYLKNKPSKYQDIQPEFFEQLNQSWKKWETRPELRALLDQYFLCYGGDGDVPPQIHSYLSTNFKELRTLPADHAMLRAKARDRWFVPDPRKNADVEQLREKRLLEEFWSYLPPGYEAAARTRKPGEPMLPGMQQPPPKLPKGKRIAIVRTEAVRVGFNFCFARNDYATIIAVSHHIPDDVIHNDEQLQMIYDSAVTRTGGETE